MDLQTLKKAELIEFAEENNIDLTDAFNKADIIARIEEGLNAESDSVDEEVNEVTVEDSVTVEEIEEENQEEAQKAEPVENIIADTNLTKDQIRNMSHQAVNALRR